MLKSDCFISKLFGQFFQATTKKINVVQTFFYAKNNRSIYCTTPLKLYPLLKIFKKHLNFQRNFWEISDLPL